jgi:hypothetical protein
MQRLRQVDVNEVAPFTKPTPVRRN